MLLLTIDNDEDDWWWRSPINYVPVCGKRVAEGADTHEVLSSVYACRLIYKQTDIVIIIIIIIIVTALFVIQQLT